MRQIITRAWIAISIAVVGAAIAVAPVTSPASPGPQYRAVQLTDINNWNDVIAAATANGTAILDHWNPAPAPALQQAVINQTGYLTDLFNGTKTLDQVVTQIGANLTAAGDAAVTPFGPASPEPFIYPSLDPTPSNISIDTFLGHLFDIPMPGHSGMLNILTDGLSFTIGICPLCTDITIPVLPLLIPDATLRAQVESVLDFSGSPLSGVLWGMVGTTLGPILQFNDDITDITAALSGPTPDWDAALQELLDMPANITNAYLNGYGEVDLVGLLNDFGITVPGLGFDPEFYLGGLLSPGGSLFNALGLEATLGDCNIACATFDLPSTAVGPLGSLIELSQAIAEALGWDGTPFA